MKTQNTAVTYLAPEVEILKITVETGFVTSPGGEADNLEDQGEW